MALVSTGYTLSVKLIDSAGLPTTRTYELQSADDATAVTDAAAILAALTAITLGEVTGYTIQHNFAEDAITTPGAGIFRNNNALLNVRLAGAGDKRAVISVPMPSSGIFVGVQGTNANTVDIADNDLAAFIALFDATGEAYVSDGEIVDELISGKRVFRDLPTT
jgi:hypothetical protein